jgi:hypothetical protein
LLYSHLSAYVLAPVFERLLRRGRMAQFIRRVERDVLPVLHISDVRWRVLDVFDAITPAIATTHDWPELKSWFESAGCDVIAQTAWCQTSAVATVSGHAPRA